MIMISWSMDLQWKKNTELKKIIRTGTTQLGD